MRTSSCHCRAGRARQNGEGALASGAWLGVGAGPGWGGRPLPVAGWCRVALFGLGLPPPAGRVGYKEPLPGRLPSASSGREGGTGPAPRRR